MRFISIHIKEGMFERNVEFSDLVNLIYSKKNSRGKTTLLRFMLYGIGYTVPNTRKIKFDKCEVETVIQTEKNGIIKLLRNDLSTIKIEKDSNISTFVLPEQEFMLHALLYSTNNADLLKNILGTFYVDQEKGWTLLNRGVVIGSIHFNIEELIRGLSGIDCSELVEKEAKLSREIDKYKQMFSVAQYQETLEKDSLVRPDYTDEVDTELDQLLIKQAYIKSELKRIDETLADNRKFKKFVSEMKLLIMAPNGDTIPVTEENIVGLSDAINILVVKRKSTAAKVAEITKQIEKLKKKRDKENEQLSFFESVDLISNFDREVSKLSLNQVTINKEIKRLEKERKAIREQISAVSNSDSEVVREIQDNICKYLEELELGDKDSIPSMYVFTSNLKELSGALLHKTAFAFRLSYIIALEKNLNIKLPIILDSPSGKEVDKDNINMMMNILKRDFNDHQIIIASIFEYPFENINMIEINNRLMEDMTNVS